ncbi:hypothetical protein ACR9YC_00420 [Parasphingorhabdus sp. DH2-15]|uniref:hypothetical protein n=1 Tax=Parasphingorhabdus sp. DH2-15 TaxID=3444112 RepID=UPI003F687F81
MTMVSHFFRMACIALICCLSLPVAVFAISPLQGASETEVFPLPVFAPETDQPLLFEHKIAREGKGWQASTIVKRCVRFTKIGRGFRADSKVVAVTDKGPPKLVALLGLAQTVRKSEHLVFDLDSNGRIIGLRDEQASWDQTVTAIKALREDLPQLIESPVGRAAGQRLIDNILATPPDQRDAYLAEGFLPILGVSPYVKPEQQLPLILPATQEQVRLAKLTKDWLMLSIMSQPVDEADKQPSGYTRSQGVLRLSRKDGLLLDSERTIETHIGSSVRVSRESWRRLPPNDSQSEQLCTAG